jgi:hypothetical protein
VRDRKVVCAVHAPHEADQARGGAARWLQGTLTDSARHGHQRIAIDAFGERVRLWSGCAGLAPSVADTHGNPFRQTLVRLLLDRRTARAKVSEGAGEALRKGRGVLALLAAGTAEDHPGLLPAQVWHHYRHDYREADSRDAIRLYPLDAGPYPRADDLLLRFAECIGHDPERWQDWLDREADALEPGERLIVSLEWQLAPCPKGQDQAQWRRDWLDAWLECGTRALAAYRRTGVLLAHCLIVETADARTAAHWTREAQALWRERRPRLPAIDERFVYLPLEPLSRVPVDDVEYFLAYHYELGKRCPGLDAFAVAEWICRQTDDGVFKSAVALVEDLHESGFLAAYDALVPPHA